MFVITNYLQCNNTETFQTFSSSSSKTTLRNDSSELKYGDLQTIQAILSLLSPNTHKRFSSHLLLDLQRLF
ncbi:hypothetical protein L6452_36249 [Arctium lappa]|uniref:Uncharacterized protein n=1 Tax=Arctium lappa TaxID=4217 RepID=A0ACB8Y8P6_ARCLA|nr:hypothetical protein L6452_36249 [Arctium lappa]